MNIVTKKMDTIRVVLLSENHVPKVVTVNPNDSIKVLDSHYDKTGQMFLVYENSVVYPSFSFSFLGIKDGDSVCAVRSKPNLIQSVQKPQNRNQNRNSIANSISDQSAALVDKFYNRLEGTSIQYRKFVSTFNSCVSQEGNSLRNTHLNIPVSPATPSTDVLPVMWSNSN